MAPPSPLAIATSSLRRLVKEEASYHKELDQQTARLQKLQGDIGDENAKYMVNQQRKAIDETKAILPELAEKIKAAIAKLNLELDSASGKDGTNADEVTKARDAIAQAQANLSATA